MTQLTIMIALLAALALGDATRSGVSPVQQSNSEDSVAVDQVSKVEPPQEQLGGGEGGWPGF
jgi:hypothetical protein